MSKALSTLPAGAKVRDPNTKYYNSAIGWIVLEHGHDGTGTTTLLTEKIISLKAFDAKEPNNSNNDRKQYGNNRYAFSNLLRWLNSEEQDWYRNMHSQDQAPDTTNTSQDPYDNEAGFLNGFSYGFKKLLKTVGKVTAKNTVTDSGGSETVYSKIFLLSNTEVGLANENNIVEGSLYSYFNSNDRRKCTATQECINNAGASKPSTASDYWYWWLRTPYASNSDSARGVNTGGSLSRNGAFYGDGGVRPACSIPADTLVSDDPDSDGFYTLQVATEPQTVGDLPIGAVVVDADTKYYNSAIKWQIIGNGHDGSNTVTMTTKDIISLKCFDGKEPQNSDANRQSYGNNRYKLSNILQWLNKSDASWYAAQHAADTPPSSDYVWENNGTKVNPYDTEAGFLTGFSTGFKKKLVEVTKKTALNTVTDGGGYEDVVSKIFLLSNTEVGLADENSIAEGTLYPFFSDNLSRMAWCNQKAIDNSNYASNPTTAQSWHYWLRTPNASYSDNARSVYTDGTLNNYYAYNGSNGVRPACSIPADTKVAAIPDSDGVYTLRFNDSPQVAPAGKDYGILNAPLQDTFTVTDADGDAFTGSVSVDGTQIQTFSGTASATVSVSLVSTWSSLSLASHTMTITVTDSESNTTTETYTFTKTAPAVYISGEDADLGRLYEVPEIVYSITESEDPVAWIKEHIDGVVTNTIIGPTVGLDYEFDLSDWDNLTNGNHTLYILAQNVNGGQGTRTYTFSKLYNHLAFRTEADETDEAAKSVLLSLAYVGAGITVEVCNNAFDTTPTWEDMTTEALAHRSYEFINDTKTAAKWGIQFKITITKSDTIKDVQCSALSYAYR